MFAWNETELGREEGLTVKNSLHGSAVAKTGEPSSVKHWEGKTYRDYGVSRERLDQEQHDVRHKWQKTKWSAHTLAKYFHCDSGFEEATKDKLGPPSGDAGQQQPTTAMRGSAGTGRESCDFRLRVRIWRWKTWAGNAKEEIKHNLQNKRHFRKKYRKYKENLEMLGIDSGTLELLGNFRN